ncbi:rhamnogalacturonan acetylesterase [Microbacter margulisiae]|uniref:Lysophospholipase L1-like esterase n=1 Tax=Microbacter margulisiae TaxID=1350067 RepID=A0A7W5DRZ7_9PORP|nr:rhamnogalacturonan acetylesterase [Microbacter margulisiae]MBB3187975.1 lysophospholipase L1-like esterase [Microbacter margulisiae]
MKKNILPFLFAFFVLLPMLAAKKTRLHTLGDSTMEQQNPNVKDQRGWVQMLQSFFTDDLTVIDPAKSGTSSKSYYEGGFWSRAKKNIRPGDYVLIQFAHNDEKDNGKESEIGTAPTDSFRIYLTRYVKEVQKLGAIPVLCTPIVRNMFGKDGRLSRRGKHDLGEIYKQEVDPLFDSNDTFTYNYPANMKLIARELRCPLIDMTALTAKLINSLGYSKAHKLIYTVGDNTHLGANGALLFSKLFINALQHQHILFEYLRPEKRLITDPPSIDMNDLFIGTESKQIFDVGYVGKTAKNKVKIIVSVSKGFKLSILPDSLYSDTLVLDCHASALSNMFKVYLMTIPQKVGNLNGQIKITSSDGETNVIPVTANVMNVFNNQPFEVMYKLSGSFKADAKGPVSAFDEQWEGLEMQNYAIPANADEVYMHAKVQKNNITGGVWPDNEIDVVYSRYIQFGFKASGDASAYAKSIELNIGGGVNFRIVGSQAKDFSNPFTIGEVANVQSVAMNKYHFPLNQLVNSGKTLYVRIYPWGNKHIKNQNLSLYNIAIRGICQKE